MALLFVSSVQAQTNATSLPSNSRSVTVVSLPESSPVTAEALVRVGGELSAAGFVVSLVQTASLPDPAVLAQLADSHNSLASFAIVESDGDSEIWIFDRLHRRTVIQRSGIDQLPSERQVPALAFSAVDLLRANLAEAWLRADDHLARASQGGAKRNDTEAASVTTNVSVPLAASADRTASTRSWGLLAGSRWIPKDNVLLFGGAGQFHRSFAPGSRWWWVLGGAVDWGRKSVGVGDVNLLAVTSSLQLGPQWSLHRTSLSLRGGMQAGVIRSHTAVADPIRFVGRTFVGPWVGPLMAADLRWRWKEAAATSVGLSLEAGMGIWTTKGFSPAGGDGTGDGNDNNGNNDTSVSEDLSLGGPWLGLRLSMEFA